MILRFILCTLCIHLSMFPSSFSSSNRSFCRFAIPLRSQRILSEAPIHRSEFSGAQAYIFPSHPMDASSSISSTPPSSIRAGYDVFISHRGPDVRNSLAYGLYHWLSMADPNIRVFLDAAEINPGDGLGPPIEHAIRTASVHVAIFSRHYAESPWCLDELCLMLESGGVVLPVFFDVQDKSVAVRMWEASGWSALEALQTLQDRCLVGYDAGGRIQVHDHLRQMGITIAKSISPPIHLRQERQICHNIEPNSINELLTLPSTRGELQPDGTRIFSQQQFPNSFTQRRNSPQSGGIDSYDCEEAASVSQFLVVEEDWLKGKLVRLLWLSLYNCPFKSIPSCFSLDNLRVLEIGARLETLWHPSSQVPVQLRDLHISSTKFRKFPKSIGGLVHLQKLTLHGSIVIKTLPEEFCDLRSLKHLELCGCAQLKYLPIRFGDLTNLQHLDLSLCTKLEWLPGSFGGLIKLQHLCLRGCYSLMVPPQILGNISTLEHLDFTECKKLEVLPYQVSDQRCLRTLRLGHTRLRELPSSLGNLKDLRELKLNDCPNLASLPESIGLLDSLCRLEIWNSMVSNLPKEIARLRNLEELSISMPNTRSEVHGAE